MAQVSQGTAHIFGSVGSLSVNGSALACTVRSYSVSKEFAVSVTMTNDVGHVIERRLDDRTKPLTITLAAKSTGFTAPVEGQLCALTSMTDTALNISYLITKVGETYTKGDYVEFTIDAIASESVTLA